LWILPKKNKTGWKWLAIATILIYSKLQLHKFYYTRPFYNNIGFILALDRRHGREAVKGQARGQKFGGWS